jgi:spore coat polysaccharide biosynthesis protein SpsF
VECFGDSPLVDPQIVDEFLGYFLKHRDSLDGVSSTLETTYPPGLEVLAYWGRVIVDVNGLVALDDPLREHAGFNIGRFPRAFRIESLRAPEEFHEPELYLEVDTIEDFEVVAAVFEHFKARGSSFGLGEILGFLRAKPEIPDRNRAVERRWRALRENDV